MKKFTKPQSCAGQLPPAPITQTELLLLFELKQFNRVHDRLRKGVLERLKAGAKVQPGRFKALIKRLSQKRATWDGLRAVLGDAAVEEIREEIPESIIHQLWVEEREPSDSQPVQAATPRKYRPKRPTSFDLD